MPVPGSLLCNYAAPRQQLHHVDAPMQTMSRSLAANRAPAEIIDDYAAGDASRGRNEPCTCGSGRKWEHCRGRSLPRATSLAITGRFPPTHA
jgi:SEC-C motif